MGLSSNPTTAALSAPLQLHRAGQWAQAAQGYQALLAQNPNQPMVWYLLGICLHQQGQSSQAIQCLYRAIWLQPRNAAFYESLGHIFQDLGKLPEARKRYKYALFLKPGCEGALKSLGEVFEVVGDWENALAYYAALLSKTPDVLDIQLKIGELLRRMGQFGTALRFYQSQLVQKPRCPELLNAMGNVYNALKQWRKATDCYQQAIRANPRFAPAYNGMAVVCQAQGRLEQAVFFHQHAVACQPNYAAAHNNLGVVLMKLNRLEMAIDHFQQVIRLSPQRPDGYTNLGTVFVKLRRVEEAQILLEKALQLNPHDARAHWNRAYLWLLLGNYAKGWPEFVWRLQLKDHPFPQWSQKPMWDGQVTPGQKILVVAEQGFGDTLQFVRYFPLLKAQGAAVLFACQPQLETLLRQDPAIDVLIPVQIPQDIADLDHDCYIHLLSLPAVLKTTLETIPPVTQMTAPKTRLTQWRKRLVSKDTFKIGIVWACHSENPTCSIRSTDLAYFKPLAEMPGVSLFSLQKGAGEKDAEAPENAAWLTSFHTDIQDFADTAAIIQNLDLVITVDTAVAHLAGMLQKPTWVLLPFENDWRWGLSGETTPWYPVMRLFRQTQRGEWDPVFAQVYQALQETLASKSKKKPNTKSKSKKRVTVGLNPQTDPG